MKRMHQQQQKIIAVTNAVCAAAANKRPRDCEKREREWRDACSALLLLMPLSGTSA